MSLSPDQLPDDLAELKRLLIVQAAELTAAKNGLIVSAPQIEKLKAQIARLKRQAFGATSERIEREIEQLELALEEAETAQAEAAAATPSVSEASPPAESAPQSDAAPQKKPRRKLPDDLPRTTETHEAPKPCDCDATQRKVGEDVPPVQCSGRGS